MRNGAEEEKINCNWWKKLIRGKLYLGLANWCLFSKSWRYRIASATLFTSFCWAGFPVVSVIAMKSKVRSRAATDKRWIDETILMLQWKKKKKLSEYIEVDKERTKKIQQESLTNLICSSSVQLNWISINYNVSGTLSFYALYEWEIEVKSSWAAQTVFILPFVLNVTNLLILTFSFLFFTKWAKKVFKYLKAT